MASDTARITNMVETPAAWSSASAICPGKPQMPAVELNAMPRLSPLSLAREPNPIMLANSIIDGKPRASFIALW